MTMQADAVCRKRDKYFLQARKNFIVGLTKSPQALKKSRRKLVMSSSLACAV